MPDFIIAGYAAPFNQPIKYEGRTESIDPAAFRAIDDDTVRLTNGHEPGRPAFASTSAGTLTLWSDSYGLAFRARISDATASARLLRRSVEGGAVQGASIGIADSDVRYQRVSGASRCRFMSISIDHIALTDTPAYAGTGIWLEGMPRSKLPLDIAALRDRWQAERPQMQPQPPRSRRGPTIDPALAAHALSMRNDFPAEAEAWFARVQARTPGRPLVIGHAGLGRPDRRPAGIRVRAPWAMVQH